MRLVLCSLTVLALALSPAAAMAQSTTADAPKPGTGHMMKDSWITTKAKSSLMFDKRVAGRQVKVETYAGVITLRGKVSGAEGRSAVEKIARGSGGVSSGSNAWQGVPQDHRKSVAAKNEGIEKGI